MSNSKTVIRRKWAFEKGRNSRSVLFAAIVTAAICMLIFGTLKYGVSTPNNWRQTTDFAIVGQHDLPTMRLIDEFDPANTYRINSGGYPFCLNCRRSHDGFCDYQDNFIKSVETFADSTSTAAVTGSDTIPLIDNTPQYTFPLSGIFAPVLPHTSSNIPTLKVTDQNGKNITSGMDKLAAISSRISRPGITVVRISGSGLLAEVKLISSSGNRRNDLEAGNILKVCSVAPGTYTIYWPGKQVTK